MQSQPNTGTTMTTSDPSKPESTLYNDSIIYEYHKHLRKVTLNRPKALNALSFDMMNSLNSEAQNWKASPDTKVETYQNFKPAKCIFRLSYLLELGIELFVLEEISKACMNFSKMNQKDTSSMKYFK